jgi:hypothetical protein
MSYRDECEKIYVENIELKKQLEEAGKVISGLSEYYDLNSDAWSAKEYEFLINAKEYLDKYGDRQ